MKTASDVHQQPPTDFMAHANHPPPGTQGPVTAILVIFFDQFDEEVDSFEGPPEEAANRAAGFILAQGFDPQNASPGRVEFVPIRGAS